MPRNDDTFAARVKSCRAALQLTQGQLAALSGLKQPDISKIELGLIEKTTGIARLADALGVAPKWLETGDGPKLSAASTNEAGKHSLQAGAHRGVPLERPNRPEILVKEFTVPASIPWEAVAGMETLPSQFTVSMPDDSLAGHVDKGTGLIFDRDLRPTPGKTVLIEDNDGNRFIRLFAMVRGEHWQAQSKSTGYVTLDSEQHGLKVLATMRWREG